MPELIDGSDDEDKSLPIRRLTEKDKPTPMIYQLLREQGENLIVIEDTGKGHLQS